MKKIRDALSIIMLTLTIALICLLMYRVLSPAWIVMPIIELCDGELV